MNKIHVEYFRREEIDTFQEKFDISCLISGQFPWKSENHLIFPIIATVFQLHNKMIYPQQNDCNKTNWKCTIRNLRSNATSKYIFHGFIHSEWTQSWPCAVNDELFKTQSIIELVVQNNTLDSEVFMKKYNIAEHLETVLKREWGRIPQPYFRAACKIIVNVGFKVKGVYIKNMNSYNKIWLFSKHLNQSTMEKMFKIVHFTAFLICDTSIAGHRYIAADSASPTIFLSHSFEIFFLKRFPTFQYIKQGCPWY